MKFNTKLEACRAWVGGFNAIPTSVIQKLAEYDRNDMLEVTYREDWSEEPDDYFPAWSTMWQFDDAIDNEWLSGRFGEDGIKIMSECGFRIYESEDFGYVFGIDGAGYSFYEVHWLPLYDARGLHWHKDGGDAEC